MFRSPVPSKRRWTARFCCFIFTEWEEFVRLSPEVFRRKMRVPLVYDGRNIFDPDNMKRCGRGVLLDWQIGGCA